MKDYAIWGIAFIGAIAFVCSLKAEVDGWFIIYTFIFAFCTATVVVLI